MKLEQAQAQIIELKNQNFKLKRSLAMTFESQFELEKYHQFAKDFIGAVAKLKEEIGDQSKDLYLCQPDDSKGKVKVIENLRIQFKALIAMLKSTIEKQKTSKQTL